MKICTATLLLLLVFTFSANAQSARAGKEAKHGHAVGHPEDLQKIMIGPNPVHLNNAHLNIVPINVTIYGYQVYTNLGEIVELENLSGRPDAMFIDLGGAVGVGTYFIVFDTDAGTITKKFMVI